MNPLLADPWIAAQIDEAVAPYRSKLTAAEVAWMREQIADMIASDEGAARIVRRAHPNPVDASGEVARDHVPGLGAKASPSVAPPSDPAPARRGRERRPRRSKKAG